MNDAGKINPGKPGKIKPCRLEQGMTLLFAAAALALAFAYAYFSSFSGFKFYDDEGFFILSARLLLRGWTVYDEVLSPYQPFFHVYNWLLFRALGLPGTHDAMRLLNIFLWIGGALVTGLIMVRLTRSRLLGLLGFMTAIGYMSCFANESGHPQVLIYLLTAGIVLLCLHAEKIPPRLLVLCTAILAGMIIMTKINAGVYVILPLAFILAWSSPGRGFRFIEPAAASLLLIMPALLMLSRLRNIPGTAVNFLVICLITALLLLPLFRVRRLPGLPIFLLISAVIAALLPFAAVGLGGAREFFTWMILTLPLTSLLLLAGSTKPELEFNPRHWLWGIVGGGGVIILSCLFLLMLGTSFHGLLKGVILLPLGLAQSDFYVSLRGNLLGGFLALAGAAGCCAYVWTEKRLQSSAKLSAFMGCLKIVFGIFLFFDFHDHDIYPFFTWLPHFWMLPFAWLLLVTPHHHDGTEKLPDFKRMLIFSLALTQPLLAYPIAGSQLMQGSVLMLIVAIVCISDGVRMLTAGLKPRPLPNLPRLAGGGLLALILLLQWQGLVMVGADYYASLTPLDLPGASRIRPEPHRVELFRTIQQILSRPEVSTFIGIPAQASFYAWTDKEPPKVMGTNILFWTMPEIDKKELLNIVQNDPGIMIILRMPLVLFYTIGKSIEDEPLMKFIRDEFTLALEGYGYQLLMRRPETEPERGAP